MTLILPIRYKKLHEALEGYCLLADSALPGSVADPDQRILQMPRTNTKEYQENYCSWYGLLTHEPQSVD